MKKYIPTLMEVYQEMIKRNDESERLYQNWKVSNPMKWRWEYEKEIVTYSDTMLHNLISIINKLNNHKR